MHARSCTISCPSANSRNVPGLGTGGPEKHMDDCKSLRGIRALDFSISAFWGLRESQWLQLGFETQFQARQTLGFIVSDPSAQPGVQQFPESAKNAANHFFPPVNVRTTTRAPNWNLCEPFFFGGRTEGETPS